MFMLIIWLQGIWLPLHGYDFARTPLWAGIYMLPLTAGFLIAGPISGILSDRYGARPFATGGMLCTALSFVLLELLPVDFNYWVFAPLLLMMGLSNGLFMSPNRAAVMNSLPPEHRGAGSGMTTTFQNSAQVLSIGIFFTLMIVGLSSVLPAQHVPRAGAARRLAPGGQPGGPPSAGIDPVRGLPRLQPDAASPRCRRSWPTCPPGTPPFSRAGRSSPTSSRAPFRHGLHTAFDFAIGACLVAAAASWSRGGRYVHAEAEVTQTDKGSAAIDPSAPLERPVS